MHSQEAWTKSTNISFGQKVLSYLAENENENDVTFLVGSEQTEIKALKIALKAACPALDKLFKEDWEKGFKRNSNKLRVPLPDLDPIAFRIFLKVLCWDDWDLIEDQLGTLNLKQQTIVHLMEISKQLEMYQLQKVFSFLNRSYFSLPPDPHFKNSTQTSPTKRLEKEIQKQINNIGIKAGGDVHVAGNVNINTPVDHSEQPPAVEFHQIDSPTPNFTGRMELLKQIHSKMLACSKESDLRERIVVLCGLGGIGKSETARRYALEYMDESVIKNVAWVDAETLTTLKDGFDSLAHQLNLLNVNSTLHETVSNIYRHFSDHIETGLIIFDNANQFNDSKFGIHEYLPTSMTLKRRPLILITSRDTKWEIPETNIISVGELTEIDSVELVIKKLGLSLTKQTDKNKLEIRKLAQSLQGFPLGLCLAASNINYSNEKHFEEEVQSYLMRMDVPAAGWIKDSQPAALTKYKLVMDNVWDMTLAKIKDLDGGDEAIKLLNLMAFFPADGITMETVSDLFEFIYEKPVGKKEYLILKNKSMLSMAKPFMSLSVSASTLQKGTQIKIHRLVQHSTREKLDAQKDYSYLQHVCNYFSHKRLHNKEYYSTTAVLCAHEHLKNRKWPLDSIRYSVLFCSFMSFFEQGSIKSSFQMVEDVYEFLGVKSMTLEDLKTEKNGINLFSLCVLWRNKNIEQDDTRQSQVSTDLKLSAKNFNESFLSLQSPLSKLSVIPKMELDMLQKYVYLRCYQKLRSLYKPTQVLFLKIRWSRKIKGFPKKLGHAAVAFGNQIVSIGGISNYSEYASDNPMNICVLNLDETELKWKLIQPNLFSPSTSIFIPGQRSFHTTVSYKNYVIIFGGLDYNFKELNTFCRFNKETLTWDEPNVTGTLPEARVSHSAVAIQNEMIIFGGRDSLNNSLNDVHCLNLDSCIWSKITTIKGTPPTLRYGHSAVVYNNRFIYIFGGHNGKEYFNALICLDWNTKEWTLPKTSGTIPKPRQLHSSFFHKGLMYIYGGQINNGSYVNDLFCYNPETGAWKEVKTIGEPPSPRRDFGCVVLGNSAYIFGGKKNWTDGLDDTFVLDLE